MTNDNQSNNNGHNDGIKPNEIEATGIPPTRSIWWTGSIDGTGILHLLDQRNIPHSITIKQHTTVHEIIESIKSMLVRGAPAIGAAGAYAMAIACINTHANNTQQLLHELQQAKQLIDSSRPTAVNLMWATSRILSLAQLMSDKHISDIQRYKSTLLHEAIELANDDVRINKSLAEYGNTLVKSLHNNNETNSVINILHHCNTGKLATVDWGTALGVIYTAHESNKNIHVYVDETRPRLQGAKLTTYELQQANIPYHLIPDSASGILMYNNKIDVILYGADRTVLNGDTANKVGTHNISVLGHEYNIPVYACVPTSTIDLTISDGRLIDIEERNSNEVTHINDVQIAPDNCPVYNPSFDVTPNKYISAIITEEGICYPPYTVSLTKAKQQAEQRIKQTWEHRLKQYGVLQ